MSHLDSLCALSLRDSQRCLGLWQLGNARGRSLVTLWIQILRMSPILRFERSLERKELLVLYLPKIY